MKKNIFHFKKFSIKQDRCAMKVGTDAVLLATIPKYKNVKSILDIGTGTGVISLMLAQQFPEALIDAVEIDESAFQQAKENFSNSPWSNHLNIFHNSFELQSFSHSYDLIISNPPYFINSLKSGSQQKDLARHASHQLLEKWLVKSKELLNSDGIISFILPYDQLNEVKKISEDIHLNINKCLNIKSFHNSDPVRVIVLISLQKTTYAEEEFVIYEDQNVYSEEYKSALKEYLTIF